ncbi:hypothetical protein DSM03_101512 [Leeuwenhoekiella aestuarii]|uniref:Uncharacterized protein n=1 Tax=Leeuwenhoekiella aestuarii TaxID=2249426 RepID=A0A4Q0NTQ6_9FLAO|nr:hypothetical protein [Leeuwenhoekiella aestuarii]RXG14392.1 hypothetical protein DSM04_104502 [Leeuwenhoekiella aestuarii]RXG19142.1 hypothetical protein DSM03_101512 [Leeuwenhoekiella aestuarii]
MSKLVTSILSIMLLTQSFNLSFGDFLHLEDLVNHYEYHQETFGDDVFSFLNKHYGELKAAHNLEHQEEREDHEKLPFEHQHCCIHSVVAFLTDFELLPEPKTIPLDQTTSNFAYRDSYSFSLVNSIFQPPKNV